MASKRPPGRPPGPPRRPPGGGGLGDDQYFYEGWRDAGQGEPRPMDVVHDPHCETPPPQAKCGKIKLNWTKFPAFNQPPFFAKPLVKARSSLVIPAGSVALIFDRTIADRQRAIVSFVGLDVAPIAPLMNSQLEFWFQLGRKGVAEVSNNIIPVWDDQNPTSYGGATPVQYGRTTVWPSVEDPLRLFESGLQFGVRGRAQFQGLIENKSGVEITVRGILGMYYYWSNSPSEGSGGASEFEAGDFQS
jgi:hypothetical protein